MANSFVGAQVRIFTKSKRHCVGTLIQFDDETSSTVIKNVKWFNDENHQDRFDIAGTMDQIIPMESILNEDIASLVIVREDQAKNASSLSCSESATTYPYPMPITSSPNPPSYENTSKSVETEKQELSIGKFYTCRKSVNELFDDVLDSISLCSSSSVSTSSRGKYKAKPRPCMLWSTSPNVQILLASTFDEVNILSDNVPISSNLPKPYILKRLLPIHPEQPFDGKRSIVPKSTTALPSTIVNRYLILIPVTVINSEKLKPTSEYIGTDDLLYINDLLQQIASEEHDEKVAVIEKIKHLSTLNNDDIDSSSSSLPITRQLCINENTSPLSFRLECNARKFGSNSMNIPKEELIHNWLNNCHGDEIDEKSNQVLAKADQSNDF